jgi:hypothetical protein
MCKYCFEEYCKGNLICEHCGAFLDLQLTLFKKETLDYKPLFGSKGKNKKKAEKKALD